MAHQARRDACVMIPEMALLRRPELAALLGVVASEWSSLESDMTFLYGALLGKAIPHNQADSPAIHPVGFQIFETLVTHETRLKLIENLAHLLIKDSDILNDLTSNLLPTLRQASRKRNNLLHAYWGINDEEYPNALMKILSPGKFEIYEKSDFDEAIDYIISTAKSVSKFEDRVVDHQKTIN